MAESSKKKKKRTLGIGQQCGDCGGQGLVEVEEGIRGVSGNGKNTNNKILISGIK